MLSKLTNVLTTQDKQVRKAEGETICWLAGTSQLHGSNYQSFSGAHVTAGRQTLRTTRTHVPAEDAYCYTADEAQHPRVGDADAVAPLCGSLDSSSWSTPK